MISAALLLGLVSSLHCVGMCGPIALMLPLDRQNAGRKALQLLSYHSGRLVSYTVLGMLFGILGKGLYLAGLQQKLSILAGAAMIVMVLISEKTFSRFNLSGPVGMLLGQARAAMARQFGRTTPLAMLTIGILNGLLPCGMVYAALLGAVALQDVVAGMSFMFFFGIGTMVLMSLVPYLGHTFSPSRRNRIRQFVPIAVGLLGVLFIIRGMGLSIPYVSPSSMSLFLGQAPDCY